MLSDDNRPSLTDIAGVISQYAAVLMGSGVHTSRVVRNSKRMADALGVEVSVSTFLKTIILDVSDNVASVNKVVEIPVLPISFEYNADLSRLSWEALDDNLSLDEIKRRFDKIVAQPRMKQWMLLLLVGAANASFCRLFSGDWVSVVVVFVATIVGLYARLRMVRRGINHYIVFICSAFIASFVTAAVLIAGSQTADIALSTSVLYLIPGVPLINGVIDILEGYILTGVARLVNTALLIICIAIGLSLTLWIVKSGLI